MLILWSWGIVAKNFLIKLKTLKSSKDRVEKGLVNPRLLKVNRSNSLNNYLTGRLMLILWSWGIVAANFLMMGDTWARIFLWAFSSVPSADFRVTSVRYSTFTNSDMTDNRLWWCRTVDGRRLLLSIDISQHPDFKFNNNNKYQKRFEKRNVNKKNKLIFFPCVKASQIEQIWSAGVR